MSRVGLVTLLQVAAGDDIFLFDVQALGGVVFEASGGGGGGGGGKSGDDDDDEASNRRSLKAVLEDPKTTKLMFDCRVDSDALFHQHGISLRGVFDVQLADVAARRRNSQAVSLLSGMPKCAARHLPKGASAAEASLAALDGPAAFSHGAGGAAAPPDADAVARVTEHLKKKVKEMYAPDKGGDGQLWAQRPMLDDVRRYAALDAWLLQEIHAAMTHSQALDEGWTKRVWDGSATRTGEYRDLTRPVLQFRDPERAVAPDF